jgi:plastocyanin
MKTKQSIKMSIFPPMKSRIHTSRALFQWVVAGLGGWVFCCAPQVFASITTNVSVVDFAFSPQAVTINLNDSVKWNWNSSFQHSTTDAGVWDSGLHNGTTFTFTRQFTSAGSFPYVCSLHRFTGSVTVQAPNSPPTVALTNPPNGAVFIAPAAFTLKAAAADSDGSVTNVRFFQGTSPLGNVASNPFSWPVTNLIVGDYAFSAVATDNGGLNGTNAITIHVVAPTPITLSAPRKPSSTSFQLTYSANPGLRYVVQRSLDLINWTALGTNMAGSSSVIFLDTNAVGSRAFYRVGRLPNP